MLMRQIQKEKYEKLQTILAGYGRVCVAFSGGVDSTLLLHAAMDALGAENVLAVTARSAFFPERETGEAAAFCALYSVPHRFIDSDSLGIEGISHNPPNRCYLCKLDLFSRICAAARERGFDMVCEGTNADDSGDYRPGMQAVAELGVRSPLREAGLHKEDIRALSKAAGLPTWGKQSFACLATRFAYGEEITTERLDMIGKAEQFLLDKGFCFVRVRLHEGETPIARIEVLPEEMGKAIACAAEIEAFFKGAGFTYVTLDLGGYRTGSMNATLPESA